MLLSTRKLLHFNIKGTEERILPVLLCLQEEDLSYMDNAAEVAEFYATLEREISKVRKEYGAEANIIILGDFNARVGTDGADNRFEEYNAQGEQCAIGTFGFEEANDNGAELNVFCVTRKFKVMDSYFERKDRDYGTWAANRSKDRRFNAATRRDFGPKGSKRQSRTGEDYI